MSENDNQNGIESQPEPLGIAGRIAKTFIQSPLTPLLLFASLAIGMMGMIITPRQEDPQISVPMVDIFVAYPGASSDQVATLAIEPLERIMSEIPGVKHVYSASNRDGGMVTVQFKVGEKMGESLVKLYDKLQSNVDKIPPGVMQPLVKPKGIDDVPVAAITLWSQQIDDAALRKLALNVVQDVKQIPDTGLSFVVGGRDEQIRIEPSVSRLASYGVSLDQLAQTVQAANVEQPAGHIELGATHFTIQAGQFLNSAKEVSQLVVGIHQGIPVYMRDVALIKQMPAETTQMARHSSGQSNPDGYKQANAEHAVTIAIAKKEGSNGVTVANAILNRVDELKGYLIPDNVEVTITRDYGKTAKDKVNELFLRLFEATVAVSVLIMITLGARPAIVVVITIPVVVLLTVFGAWVFGYTIDRVSLFALVFAIGILVDDAIVVVENIYRRWLISGTTDLATAVDAVREVGNPTILATFTVIAALLPMGFVSGMMGPYMEPIPALGSVAMLLSLITSFFFAPWLTMKIKPTMQYLKKAEEKEEKGNALIGKVYRKIMNYLLSSRITAWGTLILIFAAWLASCWLVYAEFVPVKMLPLDNKPEYNVVIDMPTGTALPLTSAATEEIAEKLRQEIPEIIDLQSYVATASPFNFNGMVRHYYLRDKPWQADIQIKLTSKHDRERSSHEIAVHTRSILKPIAEKFKAELTIAEMPPGPPVLQTLVAEVYGPDGKTRREVAEHITQVMRDLDTVEDVRNYMDSQHTYLKFQIDREKANRLGISVADISRNLAMAGGGFKVGDVKQGQAQEPTYIVMQLSFKDRANLSRLEQLPLRSRTGELVPLSTLGQFIKVQADPVIYHKDLRPVEYVVGDTVGRLAAPIYGMMTVDNALKDYTTPDGVQISGEYIQAPENSERSGFLWGGEWTVTYETFRDMGIAFAVALILIYILVVWEFQNFKVPLVIISPIPLTLIGIIPGHWLIGAEFTATSMIGFIALAGIIVRNSILLVDFTQQQIREGTEVKEALCMAGQIRMRPIVLTALALVAGSFFMFPDPIFRGMAISLAFGVVVATFLTLIVIPMGCLSWKSALCASIGSEPEPDPEDPKDRAKKRVFDMLGESQRLRQSTENHRSSGTSAPRSIEVVNLTTVSKSDAGSSDSQKNDQSSSELSIAKPEQIDSTEQNRTTEKKTENGPNKKLAVKKVAKKTSSKKKVLNKTGGKKTASTKTASKKKTVKKTGRRGIQLKKKTT